MQLQWLVGEFFWYSDEVPMYVQMGSVHKRPPINLNEDVSEPF